MRERWLGQDLWGFFREEGNEDADDDGCGVGENEDGMW